MNYADSKLETQNWKLETLFFFNLSAPTYYNKSTFAFEGEWLEWQYFVSSRKSIFNESLISLKSEELSWTKKANYV